jgi:hypothetical protein
LVRSLLVLLLGAGLVAADDTKPGDTAPEKKKTAAEVEIADPGTPIEDASVARQEVSRFEKEMREAKDALAEVKLLDRLGGWDHPEVFKAAAKRVKDREHIVAVAAIVAVARQGKSKDAAGRALMGVLKTEKRTDLVCAALVGLGRLGIDSKAAVSEATKLFQRDAKETHKAATRYFGYIKYKPAFRMIAEKLDQPEPANPNDPNNPPESYWKERWEEWSSNVPHTRWALAQLIPGETFETTAEAKLWAESEGKEHDIEW